MTDKNSDRKENAKKNLPEQLSEAEIITLLENRDEGAVAALQARFGSRCRAVSFGILGSEEDAEECVNDVLLKVWNSIPPVRPDSLAAYVDTIAKNTAIDRYRAQRSTARIPPEKSEPIEKAECIGVRDVDPTDKETVAALIAGYLRSVTPEKRKLFVARYHYCMTEAEIAKKTGNPKGTVSAALSRMRKELSKYLKAEGIEL